MRQQSLTKATGKEHIRVSAHLHLQTRPSPMTHWLHSQLHFRMPGVSSPQQHLEIIFEQDQPPADDGQT